MSNRRINQAKAQLKRASRLTFWLSRLVARPSRPYFWCCYAYFRWVDDVADDASSGRDVRLDFIARQRALLDALYDGAPSDLADAEEFLALLVAHDQRRGAALRPWLADMLGAIEADIARGDTLVDHATLRANFARETHSFLATFAVLLDQPVQGRPAGADAAVGAKMAHVLRDFAEDIRAGEVNISREDLRDIGCDLAELPALADSEALRLWAGVQTRQADAMLAHGLAEACGAGNLRYRLLVAVLTTKYQSILADLRGADFDLLTPRKSSRLAALGLLSRNLRAALGRRPKPATTQPPLDPLIPGRALTPANIAALLAPDLRRFRRELSGAEVALSTKQQSRLAQGYVFGKLVCGHGWDRPGASERATAREFGRLFAWWAGVFLSADALVDSLSVDIAVSRGLLNDWAAQVEALVNGTQSAPTPIHGAYPQFDFFANGFLDSLARLLGFDLAGAGDATARDRFLRELHVLVAAQLASRAQMEHEVERGWAWYFDEIMEQKTSTVFSAPVFLVQFLGGDAGRMTRLYADFETLNHCYFHWQLLDDISDIEVDCEELLLTSPGYILLSQGRLAEAWQAGGDLPAALEDSALCVPPFRASPLCDDVRAGLFSDDAARAQEAELRCALANTTAEVSMPLHALADLRAEQATTLRVALAAGDGAAIKGIVLAGNGCNRIWQAAWNPGRRGWVRSQLAGAPGQRILWIIERLILNAANKTRALLARLGDGGQGGGQ